MLHPPVSRTTARGSQGCDRWFSRLTGSIDPCHSVTTTNQACETQVAAGLAAALDTLQRKSLHECVGKCLAEGRDDRLHLNADGVDKFFSPPRPLDNDVAIRVAAHVHPDRRGHL